MSTPDHDVATQARVLCVACRRSDTSSLFLSHMAGCPFWKVYQDLSDWHALAAEEPRRAQILALLNLMQAFAIVPVTA